jgi:hypothetical protein
MTLKQTGLLPTSRNEIRAMLSTFELVAGSRLQLGEVAWAKFANALRLSQAHRYSTGLKSGEYSGRKSIWI